MEGGFSRFTSRSPRKLPDQVAALDWSRTFADEGSHEGEGSHGSLGRLRLERQQSFLNRLHIGWRESSSSSTSRPPCRRHEFQPNLIQAFRVAHRLTAASGNFYSRVGGSATHAELSVLQHTGRPMATINHLGNVSARCPSCRGGLSTFEWRIDGKELGVVRIPGIFRMRDGSQGVPSHRLYCCAGCGSGALGLVICRDDDFPNGRMELRDFYREVTETLPLPKGTPDGIQNEFEEAEKCISVGAYRAAAGLFRSVLDKTLRANGYKLKPGTPLEQQIEMAGADGVITAARLRKAHDEVRVLGNDVLHEEWRKIAAQDVEAAHHYAQRIIEDFYDERTSVLKVLRAKGRIPDEDRVNAEENGS